MGSSKTKLKVIRCFELEPAITADAVGKRCSISRQAVLKRMARLRKEGALIPVHLVKTSFTTFPVHFAIFISVDARDFKRHKHGITDIVGLADYILTKALISTEWKEIVEEENDDDHDIRLEGVYPLSGAGEWDMLIMTRAASAEFIRHAFVTKFLPQLPGVVKTNTATVITPMNSFQGKP